MPQNPLASETSPYLLQHADNPVDWHPWNAAALQKAHDANKPILLSIGYSACHWCHVMAHESFEDPATAEVMNTLYVNIKVDREERPDLDKIYQTAHQLLNQRPGGWPLTIILTPDDHTPFFAGTYFPNQPRHGMPPFTEVLRHVADFYHQHQADIRQQNQALLQAMQRLNPVTPGRVSLDATPLDEARHQLAHNFDSVNGGFGQAPKFPHPSNLERLQRHWAGTCLNGHADEHARAMLRTTLHAMASGGIYDQLGGGFCRYSVDDKWMIPHFEKMLYDNGPLLHGYAEAWHAFGDPAFRRIAAQTAEWVRNEMQSPEGGYYSTLDADSEGEEGSFYVWTPQQAQTLLDNEEYALLSRHYGLDRAANFEGHWHLHVYRALEDIAQELNLDATQARDLLDRGRAKLLAARAKRVHPGRDEKILSAWNGLMIKGMACAGRRLQREDFITSAQAAVDFIRHHMWLDNRLLAGYKDGQARLMAYLDDYAFLLDGLLELLQARWRDSDMQFAVQLADGLLEHYEDREQGGFFFTANDHEALFHRPKPTMDESIPAGNGIAAHALARLGHLLGEMRYLNAAERTLHMSWNSLRQLPYAHCALLLALEEHLYPPQLIILRGETAAMQPWQQRCNAHYAPRRICLAIPNDSQYLPGLLAQHHITDQVTAYPCTGTRCQPPVRRLEDLEPLLAETEAGGRKDF